MLSDKRILEEINRGNIVIEPFEPRQLGTNSYDVRLGPYYFVPNHNVVSVDFTNLEDARAFWQGPMYADDGFMHIRPGDTILAHTIEIIGAHNGFTSAMGARSSIGRSCLAVCKCAGVGDVGYISRWTMEISNLSHAIIRLPVGQRVAQIMFNEVGNTVKEYSGKYGSRSEWTPEDMLPKLYRDWDLDPDGHIWVPYTIDDPKPDHANGHSMFRFPGNSLLTR
jgi:dCTP deaminase